MAAMKPRTGDGPLEVTKEGRGIVMRVPLEGGGRLVVEISADEASALGDALKAVVELTAEPTAAGRGSRQCTVSPGCARSPGTRAPGRNTAHGLMSRAGDSADPARSSAVRRLSPGRSGTDRRSARRSRSRRTPRLRALPPGLAVRRCPRRVAGPGRSPPSAIAALEPGAVRGVVVHQQCRCTPSCTTSGMPPTSLATTAAPHAIASRLTMPSGSYTDGQTNTVDADSTCLTSGRVSMPSNQNTPGRGACSSAIAAAVSAAISGVSGAPAHSTSWTPGSKWWVAAIRWPTPFCRVIRPTNDAIGAFRSTPLSISSRALLGGLVDLGVDAVADDVHLRPGPAPGSSPGCPRFMPVDTEMIASAPSYAVFSAHDDTR